MRRLYPAFLPQILSPAAQRERLAAAELGQPARPRRPGARQAERRAAARIGDARLPQVEQALLAERPTFASLNEVQLSWWLSKMREVLTVDDPRVRQLLGRRSPEALAARLANGTRLGDLASAAGYGKAGSPRSRRRTIP